MKRRFLAAIAASIVWLPFWAAAQDGADLTPRQENGGWGYVNSAGKKVIPFKYDYAWNFSDSLAKVALDGEYGYIDKTGNEVIPFKYDDAGDFSDGLAWVKLDWKYGYIDKTGNEVIPFKYDGTRAFSEDMAAVKLNGKWGFVDETGKEIVPLKYDDIWDFSNGIGAIELKGTGWTFVDKTGKIFSKTRKISIEQPFVIFKRDERKLTLFHYPAENRLYENDVNGLKTIVYIEDIFRESSYYGTRHSVSIQIYDAIIRCLNLKNGKYEEIYIKNNFNLPKMISNKGVEASRGNDNKWYVHKEIIIETLKSKMK